MSASLVQWEVANPLTSEQIIELLRSGVEVTGSLTFSMQGATPAMVEALERIAAKNGIMLVRTVASDPST